MGTVELAKNMTSESSEKAVENQKPYTAVSKTVDGKIQIVSLSPKFI